MAPSDVTVRHACREDAPVILELIQALADYEKEPDAVEATVETLQQTISFAASDAPDAPLAPLSPARPARCLLLFAPGEAKAAAMALYFYSYSTWRSRPGIYLEDLFVQPAARGRGYGKLLLVQLAKQLRAMDGGRLDWSVLKWNEPSIRFYRSLGARALDEWVGMRVEGPALDKLARLLD